MSTVSRIALLLCAVFPAASGMAQEFSLWRADTLVSWPDPAKATGRLVLVNDLNSDGKKEAVVQVRDLRSGEDAEFRIYSLKSEGGKVVVDQELKRIKTSDDYCKAIELRDIDQDGLPELLLTTVGKDQRTAQLHVVRWSRKFGTFEPVPWLPAPNAREASWTFRPRSGENPPECTVLSVRPDRQALFETPQPAGGQLPQCWIRQTYFVQDAGLKLFETTAVDTPYFVLDKFLRSLREQKFFPAYRFYFSETPYHEFRRTMLREFPTLVAAPARTRWLLNNWFLELYRDQRSSGWMTFTQEFEQDGRKKSILFQAFLRRVYDEWKVTLLRKLQET